MPSDRFEVRLTRRTQKDLEGLRPWTERAVRALVALESDPFRGHALRGSLRRARSLEFSLRGGSVYRAAYVVLEAERVCLVFMIGPHENFYEGARRRFEALRAQGEV